MTDLNVKCEKNDVQPSMADVKSSTKGMAFGNILFGGVIGAGVDIANGSAFDYPTLIQVQMGDAIVIAPHAPAAVADKVNATYSVTLQANADNVGTTLKQ